MNEIYTDIFDTYTESLGYPMSQYVDIEIHGVVDINSGDIESDETQCQIDDENPQFFSVYVRHKDGCSEVIADAGLNKLYDLREFAQLLANQNQWNYNDYTLRSGVKNYDVHCYVVVRVSARSIEAEGHQKAIEKAEATLNFHTMLKIGMDVEYAEMVIGHTVDELGDENYTKTVNYN